MDEKLKELIQDPECLFVVSHSGGKDSQAMFGFVSKLVPKCRILVLHATLGEIEWEGTIEHIQGNIDDTDFQVVGHHSGETLLSLAKKRGAWPSPKQRSCTSQLKTGPLEKAIRHELKRRGLRKIVSCIGLRAEESSQRQKQAEFQLDEKNSKAGREWYRWLPIHSWSTGMVFGYITALGQKPHWAYAEGMTRLSCYFCILASKQDLKTAARLNPKLLEKYTKMEHELGQSLIMPSKKHGRRFLKQIVDED